MAAKGGFEEKEEYECYCSDDSSDEEDEDEELGEVVELPKVKRGRRNTVMATKMKVDDAWVAPIFEKDAETRTKIEKLVSKIFMFEKYVLLETMQFLSSTRRSLLCWVYSLCDKWDPYV